MELPCPATRSRRGRSPPSLRAPLCCVPPYNPTTLVASWEEPALTEGAAAHPPHVTWEEPALAEGAAGSSTWTSVPCDAVASWDEPALTEGAAAHQTPTTCTSWEEPALTKGAAFSVFSCFGLASRVIFIRRIASFSDSPASVVGGGLRFAAS